MIKDLAIYFFFILGFNIGFILYDNARKETNCKYYQTLINKPTKFVKMKFGLLNYECFIQTKDGWVPLESLRSTL